MNPFAQIDGIADGLDLAHVVALEGHAVLVLDDLRAQRDRARVDVEVLERRVARDLVSSTPNWGTL
jgi:hypothetical protein